MCHDRSGFGLSDGCNVVGVVFDQVLAETSTTTWWRMPVNGNGGVDDSGGGGADASRRPPRPAA